MVNNKALSETTIAKIKRFVSIQSMKKEAMHVTPATKVSHQTQAPASPSKKNGQLSANITQSQTNMKYQETAIQDTYAIDEMEGININDIDEDEEDEDLLDDY
jgi:hypothetical protein